VIDALTPSILEDALRFEKKLNEILEKDSDKMNRTAYCVIRSSLTQDVKYNVMNEISIGKI